MSDIETREDIEQLVDSFYKQVLQDPQIGHFFTEVVQLDWEKHIPVMYDFWESILLGASRYKGNPMVKHFDLDQKASLEAVHFERWLALWEQTLKKHFTGPKAAEALSRARQIAALMQVKVQQQRN